MLVRNGVVGDWRVSDDEFMVSFRLSSERLDTLKRANPFPREARINFDEASHAYAVDCIDVPLSVTALVHQFSADSNARACVEQMQSRDSWAQGQREFKRDDGTPMTTEEIMQRWAANAQVQRSRGTLLHYQIEQFLNCATIEQPHSPEFQQFLEIDRLVLSKYTIYRTELSMCHCGLGIAGQADCLCLDDNGGIVIWDWKRTKNIRMDSRQQMLPPLQHLPDCNYFTYALQLNLYRYILETEYLMPVSKMILGIVHPLNSGPMCLEVPRLDVEVALIVEHSGGREPRPDAVFCVEKLFGKTTVAAARGHQTGCRCDCGKLWETSVLAQPSLPKYGEES